MAGNRRWTTEEINYLINEYGTTDIDNLSSKLNRSVDSIQWKAAQMNIEFKKNDLILLNNKLEEILSRLDEVEQTVKKIELEPNIQETLNMKQIFTELMSQRKWYSGTSINRTQAGEIKNRFFQGKLSIGRQWEVLLELGYKISVSK